MKSCSRMFEPLWTVEPLNQCARVPRRSSVGAFQRVESGEQLSYERRFEQVIGNSPALEEVLEQVERVAPTDSTVLIQGETDRKSTRLNSSHPSISYAVFCLKKKKLSYDMPSRH